MKYSIRFNKARGQEGWGTREHVWRVFEGEKEYLVKHLDITVPIKSEKDPNGQDYNICCEGLMALDRETSTAAIRQEKSNITKPEQVSTAKDVKDASVVAIKARSNGAAL